MHYFDLTEDVPTTTRVLELAAAGTDTVLAPQCGLAPGLIGTRFHDVFNTPEGRRTTVERTPLRREGTPEDVAETILFLASPRASFLTGETIQINGGLGMF